MAKAQGDVALWRRYVAESAVEKVLNGNCQSADQPNTSP